MNPHDSEFLPRLKVGEKRYVPTGDAILSAGAKPAGEGKPRCKKCSYRVRGPGHEEGAHHKRGRR